jgi:hypothetical protein
MSSVGGYIFTYNALEQQLVRVDDGLVKTWGDKWMKEAIEETRGA